MKPAIYVFIALFTTCVNCLAQQEVPKINSLAVGQLPPMSSNDSIKLAQLPSLKLPEGATKRLIPISVDNSQLQYFRPLFTQSGLECGQASSIGLVFTYEMCYMKNVPANVETNQYATYFTYNFINNGSDAGVNFYETFEILKYAGNPTVYDYGGMSYGGPSRWMSGYNLYYNAMKNRVKEVYSINLANYDGIQTLKNWLFDHGDGSSSGGIACFYAQYTNPVYVLPENTPEGGKAVITTWGASANHSMTIVGYNDSIRWDYNEDGIFTNNIDLNFDGQIDVRDWEIGGFKIANTYGSVYNWGDQGFSYITYKSVADLYQQGGIWNNTAVVIDVNETYQPQLTAKVNLTHQCRNRLKVMAGVSSDINALEPDYILHYPIFEFQGNCYNMQGNGGPDNIEFGLDLNPLLQYINTAEPSKFFLMVQENDPIGVNVGTLNSFALVDYTNNGAVISSAVNNMPLTNNAVTYANVNATINFSQVEIVNDTLPPVVLYSNTSLQLQASGGTAPYSWRLVEKYQRFDSTAVMHQIADLKLQPSDGRIKVELPFSFPYFGNKFDAVYATTGGYLLMEDSNIPWPFYIEGRTYFIQKPMVAPYTSNTFFIANSADGIWFESTPDYVTFRWKLSVNGASGYTINTTARLYKDGKIEFNYGDCLLPPFIERFAGISAGNGHAYTLLTYNPDFLPSEDMFIRFTQIENHEGIKLDESGLLSFILNSPINGQPLTVYVNDNNNVGKTKTLTVNSSGLQLEYEILAGDDDVISYGEDVWMNLHVTNLYTEPIGAVNLTLSTLAQYYNIVDGQASIDGILPGQEIIIPSAFQIKAHNNLPDNYTGSFQINATAAGEPGLWTINFQLVGYSAAFKLTGITVTDGNNGYLEPGETATLEMDLLNIGGASLTSAEVILSSLSNFASVLSGSYQMDTVYTQQSLKLTFDIAVSPDVAMFEVINFNLTVTGDLEYMQQIIVPLLVGNLEDGFESGDFSTFDWTTSGNASWFIEDGYAYEGYTNARSGLITHNQKSLLTLPWVTAYPDTISFYYKVSSESNYDHLTFKINGNQLGKWSGLIPWTKASIPVAAGVTNFEWKYAKDYSEDANEDCARIDLVVLPMYTVDIATQNIENVSAQLSVYPNPAAEKVFLSYSVDVATDIDIFIVDLKGSVLYYKQDRAQAGIKYSLNPSINNMKPGAYSCVLKTNSHLLVKKLIIF